MADGGEKGPPTEPAQSQQNLTLTSRALFAAGLIHSSTAWRAVLSAIALATEEGFAEAGARGRKKPTLQYSRPQRFA
jgi:hypothetical protein